MPSLLFANTALFFHSSDAEGDGNVLHVLAPCFGDSLHVLQRAVPVCDAPAVLLFSLSLNVSFLPPGFTFHTLEKTSTANQSNLGINWGLKHNVPLLVLRVALLNFTALGHTHTQTHRSTLIPGAT